MSLKFCIILKSNSQKNFFAIVLYINMAAEKPFVKLRIANFAKLVVSYVVKGKQLKKAAGFRASRRLRFEDAKRIMSPETRPT